MHEPYTHITNTNNQPTNITKNSKNNNKNNNYKIKIIKKEKMKNDQTE